MKRVFGAIAFVIGVGDITGGILKISRHESYGVLLLLIGIAFIGFGVWLQWKAFKKGKSYV